MQTLGLSDSTPRTEGRLKSLFWPSIGTDNDVDYLTRQGFWLCTIVAGLTLLLALVTGTIAAAMLDVGFFSFAALASALAIVWRPFAPSRRTSSPAS